MQEATLLQLTEATYPVMDNEYQDSKRHHGRIDQNRIEDRISELIPSIFIYKQCRIVCCIMSSFTFSILPHYFYIARCCDNSLYSGTCVNLQKREAMHNDGKGAKYTRSRLPVTFVYHEEYETLGEARGREAQVKRMKREEKERLLSNTHYDR